MPTDRELFLAWDEDEEGEREGSMRLVRGNQNKDKIPRRPWSEIDPRKHPDLLSGMAVEGAAQQEGEAAVREAHRLALEAAEHKTTSGFQAEIVADGPDVTILLQDEEGTVLTRPKKHIRRTAVGPKGEAEQVPLSLTDLLPQLKNKKIHLRQEERPGGQGLRFDEVNDERVLWIPSDVGAADRPRLVLEIIRLVVEGEVAEAAKKAATKREEVQTTYKNLHREHTTEHRQHKIHTAEEKFVEAEHERLRQLEEEFNNIFAQAMKEYHLDLASPVGGTAAFLRQYEQASQVALEPDVTGWKKDHLVHGPHHPHYEGFTGKLLEFHDKNFRYPLLADRKMIQAMYEEREAAAQSLPDGSLKNWLIKKPGKLWRMVAKNTRMAWQAPRHAYLKPAFYVGAVGAGILATLWDVTNIWPFKMSKEEVKNWGKWILHQVGIEGGKGGKGGEHH